MLVNKSGRRLVIGRINVKNEEILPGIPFTADERKGIEKFIKKGYIVEVEATEAEAKAVEAPEVEEHKAEESKVEEPKVEEPKVESVKAEEHKSEEPKAGDPNAEEHKSEEPKPASTVSKYSRRKKKNVEVATEEKVTEDGNGNND